MLLPVLQAHNKAKADALARVGSRSPAAEAVTQLLLYGRPAAWLPNPVVAALLQLVAQDPRGEDAELVQGAYQLLLAFSKVGEGGLGHRPVCSGLQPAVRPACSTGELCLWLHAADMGWAAVCIGAPCCKELPLMSCRPCCCFDFHVQAAPVLAAGLLPELHQLMLSPDTELQQLGVRMFARCAAQMRKCGSVLTASSNAATVKLVKQQILPALKRMSRGQPPAASKSGLQGSDEGPASLGLSSQEGPVQVAPKSAKWAVLGMAACQDSTSTKQELQDIADELVSSLDAGAPDTAAKLQALSIVGRVLPGECTRLVVGSNSTAAPNLIRCVKANGGCFDPAA